MVVFARSSSFLTHWCRYFETSIFLLGYLFYASGGTVFTIYITPLFIDVYNVSELCVFVCLCVCVLACLCVCVCVYLFVRFSFPFSFPFLMDG